MQSSGLGEDGLLHLQPARQIDQGLGGDANLAARGSTANGLDRLD